MDFMDIKKPRNVRGMYILVNFMDIKKPRNFRGIPIFMDFMDFMVSTKRRN